MPDHMAEENLAAGSAFCRMLRGHRSNVGLAWTEVAGSSLVVRAEGPSIPVVDTHCWAPMQTQRRSRSLLDRGWRTDSASTEVESMNLVVG